METLNGLSILVEDYQLKEEQIAYYRKNGHIFIKQMVMASVVDHFRSSIGELAREMYKEDSHLSIYEGAEKQSMLISHLWKRSQFLSQLTFAKRFAKTAAMLMGVKAVRLYVDYAVFKEPGDKATGWHQDHNHTLIGTENTITMWMPLLDLPLELGSMEFISESHTLTDRTKGDSLHLRAAHRKRWEHMHYGAMQRGDVTFHSGWVLHSSYPNQTDQVREVYSITYLEDGSIMLDPGANEILRETIVGSVHFPDTNPGDLIQGDHFPLLYS